MIDNTQVISRLKKNELFSTLSDEEMAEIISKVRYTLKTYNKDQIIASEDEECDSLGLVINGTIEIQRLYSNGKHIVLKRLDAGEVFGEAIIFSKRNKYPATVLSVTDAVIAYIKKDDIVKMCLLKESVLKNFVTLLSDKIFVLNRKIKNISFKSVREKVINFILEQRKEQKSDNIKIKMSKEQISAMIGIPRPSLSRELMKLRDEGAIEFDRNSITIVDLESLENQLLD